jgi:polyisoprenoid-binding protein YceI
MKRFALITLAALAFASNAFAAKYAIDPTHTQVEFTYSHFGFSNITGRFDQVNGEFELNTADLAKSRINIEIPISSMSTGVQKLDQHLQGPDFFDAAKFPTATF